MTDPSINTPQVDYVAIDRYRRYLMRTRPWSVVWFDQLTPQDQTRMAIQHENQLDDQEDRESHGGPGA